MTILGNPEAEAQLEAAYWANHPTCPANPDAECKHCGVELEHHPTEDGPDAIPTPGNAICLDDTALLQRRVVWNRFELADGESFACPEMVRYFCEGEVCTEHSPEFVTCVDSSDVHHVDCRDRCVPCQDVEAAEFRDQMRREW